MRLFVTVKPNSQQEKVEKVGGNYVVYIKAAPIENRANLALIKSSAEYFKIPKSQIAIISGYKSKRKVIKVKSI